MFSKIILIDKFEIVKGTEKFPNIIYDNFPVCFTSHQQDQISRH